MASLNVFKKPLHLHSTKPLTGFLRTGYCEVPASDVGNHSVAAVVSDEFLDFSAARGNNLRAAGLTGGCKWCLCAGRWLEALRAFEARGSAAGEEGALVPKVYLNATNEKALEKINLDDLKRFALDREEASSSS
ncbi:hypothetical protein K432DRAFT_420354 [Lepidopterella palustris CBS 459.81]|uniref:Uncharacterized protein n=1 Tax=Lepidopterella palustris CBS 459.81 TaxID=1314670 RepID=A0A8E2J9I8_9PEZI|nr:hypothetical protein K432DRAFT_420354 [Lepidopterella palustris CBS 459.81]